MSRSVAEETESMGAGVLHARTAAARLTLNRYPPSAGLAALVNNYWTVRWDLRGQPPHEQAILPHPTVNLAFEAAGAAVHGVDRKIFTRRIAEEGRVLGVRFRPGGFRPFYGRSVAALNDRVVPARSIFGPAADEACEAVMTDGASDDAMVAAAEELLLGQRVAADPLAERVAGIVERITADPGLRRVTALTEVAGMTERRLQRLFAQYVGVSPKWVMRRARLHEAALRAEAGADVDWPALALDLGYADQAHLVRDFTATLGVSPARYASRG
ncbi:AraC family transcriptional regulator [Trebonia kvetii]|nr:helix-turn-helix domain-containing protein [Trebonia kvetii]